MIRKVRDIALQLITRAHEHKKIVAMLRLMELNNLDNRGYTILHYVAELGNADLIVTLCNNGANANIEDHYGQLPLHLAARHGNLKAVVALLKITKNIDAQDRYGNSSLHLAAKHGDIVIVKRLLKYGALVNTLNEHGLTAVALAEENRHIAIVKLLRSYGGKKVKNVLAAVIEAYQETDIIRKIALNLFIIIVLGGSMFATIATKGQLWFSVIGATGASIGLAMVCLEKPYRYIRMRERYQHNEKVEVAK